MPGVHAILLILVTLAAFYLYTRSWIQIEMVSLLLLLALVVLFYLITIVKLGGASCPGAPATAAPRSH